MLRLALVVYSFYGALCAPPRSRVAVVVGSIDQARACRAQISAANRSARWWAGPRRGDGCCDDCCGLMVVEATVDRAMERVDAVTKRTIHQNAKQQLEIQNLHKEVRPQRPA